MIHIITAPVLIIGFNRPDVIKQCFDMMRTARPQKLYVAIDGPRKNRPDDKDLIEAVKKIVLEVDWDCKVDYKFSYENLGAEINVSSSVSWVLEKEQFVIVLEDDIIAPLSFLSFAQDMLLKYCDNDNVFMISSNQPTPIEMPNEEDYLFGIYGHIWGWATWRRAWDNFDLNINDFDKMLNSNDLNDLVQTEEEKRFWRSTIKRMKRKGAGKNTWDICWSYIRFKKQGLTVIPRVNLSSNIGDVGLHSKGRTLEHFRPFDKTFKVKKHPVKVLRNSKYDMYHFKNHINKRNNYIQRIFGKMLRILKVK